MVIWNYMAGGAGMHEGYVLGNGRVHMNFNLDRSAFGFERKDDLRDYLMDHKWLGLRIERRVAAQDAGNLWRFSRDAQPGDIVVLWRRPSATRTIAVGEILGDYNFDPTLSAGENQPGPHYRVVDWVVRSLPIERCGFEPDWLPIARQTFTRIHLEEENAEQRILDAVSRWH